MAFFSGIFAIFKWLKNNKILSFDIFMLEESEKSLTQ